MNYFFIISAILIVFGVQASQESPPVKVFSMNEIGSQWIALSEYQTYQYKEKVFECRKEILESNGLNGVDIIRCCSVLWAVYAWCLIYCNESSDNIAQYEQPIAERIKEFINNGDCMQGVLKTYGFTKEMFWRHQGKHILHRLFELPCYSSVMRDLWQEIKLRPTQDIINYSDEKTELFLDMVFKDLKEDGPNALSKIEFLWHHSFLPTQWMKDLHIKVSQKLQKTVNKLKCLNETPHVWLNQRKKNKGGLKKAIERNENKKNNLIKCRPAIAQLLAYPYQNKLLSQQMCGNFVDSNIITQD